MNRGFIKVWRKVEDSGLLQLPNTLALFMFLLLKAAHKPRKIGTPSGVIELKRGQYISGRHKLSETLSQSEQQVRSGLERLVAMEIITIQSTNRYSIYTIVNYGIYQDDNQQITSTDTNKQPTDNQQITTKEELKELKNLKNKYIPPINPDLLKDWLAVRKKKNACDMTERVFKGLQREARIAGLTDEQAVTVCCERSWQTFTASYYTKPKPSGSVQEARLDVARQIFGERNGNENKIIDITPRTEIASDGNDIQKAITGVRKPDAS